MIDKKQLLFDLRNVIKHITKEDLQEIFDRIKSYVTNGFYLALYFDKNQQQYMQIFSDGSQYWKKENKFHRNNDKPAIYRPSNSTIWYNNGKIHRDNGPAVICANGNVEYWINGKLQIFLV